MNKKTEKPTLCTIRRFAVPPGKVFHAFTNPELMRTWWGPDTTFDIDLRIGGR